MPILTTWPWGWHDPEFFRLTWAYLGVLTIAVVVLFVLLIALSRRLPKP